MPPDLDRAALKQSTLMLCGTLAAGFALLSAVVWFGLKGLASAVTQGGVARPSAPLAAPSIATTTGVENRPPTPPTPAAPDQELRLRDDIAMAFAAQKGLYVQACFHPGRARPQAYDLELKFDANGNELSRTVRAVPGAKPQPELDDCVVKLKAPAMKVAPPGQVVTGHLSVVVP